MHGTDGPGSLRYMGEVTWYLQGSGTLEWVDYIFRFFS